LPELPEVETVVRGLRERLVSQTITGVEVFWERTIAAPSPAEFTAGVTGQRILGVDRRGKYIIMHLQRGDLLVHLRMTGQLLLAPKSEAAGCRHLRLALDLDGGRLLFNDARKFGRMCLVPDAATFLATLGPEPLDASFAAADLAGRLGKRHAPIKALLLDQSFLAGVGNIYADEALYTAGIAPERSACSLTGAEAVALHAALRSELARAIANRGTTLSDYRDAGGQQGAHQEALYVYGREGQPCRRCGCAIVRNRLRGRSSYRCPRCQT